MKKSFRALLENMINGEIIILHADQYDKIRIRYVDKTYDVQYRESYFDSLINKIVINKEERKFTEVAELLLFICKYYSINQINLCWVGV